MVKSLRLLSTTGNLQFTHNSHIRVILLSFTTEQRFFFFYHLIDTLDKWLRLRTIVPITASTSKHWREATKWFLWSWHTLNGKSIFFGELCPSLLPQSIWGAYGGDAFLDSSINSENPESCEYFHRTMLIAHHPNFLIFNSLLIAFLALKSTALIHLHQRKTNSIEVHFQHLSAR